MPGSPQRRDRCLAKVGAEGSNPFARSKTHKGLARIEIVLGP